MSERLKGWLSRGGWSRRRGWTEGQREAVQLMVMRPISEVLAAESFEVLTKAVWRRGLEAGLAIGLTGSNAVLLGVLWERGESSWLALLLLHVVVAGGLVFGVVWTAGLGMLLTYRDAVRPWLPAGHAWKVRRPGEVVR